MSRAARLWGGLDRRFMPFRDARVGEAGLARLLRLSLFQVSVGMAVALVIGTLNRVMIVELGVPAGLVGIMVGIPLLFAPFRAVIGYRSDVHVSVLGWRRVPFLWMGTLVQFGGFAIMPFALLLLGPDSHAPVIVGRLAAGFAFLLVGAGLHTVQTVGLALATDITPTRSRPMVVSLLSVMLLVGVLASALVFGALLQPYSPKRLIQVVQGAAVVTMMLNGVALWKQETRGAARRPAETTRGGLAEAWRMLGSGVSNRRRLVAVGIGTAAFSLQDVLLEPYGGQVLHLPVASTTSLTALLAVGGLLGFGGAARLLSRGVDRHRVAAIGALVGLVAFPSVIVAGPLGSTACFAGGTTLVGAGGALFLAGTLSGAIDGAGEGASGFALGTWGAVQSFAAGGAIAVGALLRDLVTRLDAASPFAAVLPPETTGYDAVYAFETLLLFATLVALGKLVRFRPSLPISRREFA